MQVCFSLLPLEQLRPLQTCRSARLSWYALSEGEYWLPLDGQTLFEYAAPLRNEMGSRYCCYALARLHQELLERLPHVLDPVPVDLVRHLASSERLWPGAQSLWCTPPKSAGQPPLWDLIDAGTAWLGRRMLDCSWLSPTVRLLCWSDETHVHLEWDQRDVQVQGEPAWTAQAGSACVPRSEFLAGIETFHRSLMHQMHGRVAEALQGALGPDVRVERRWLLHEHEQRREALQKAMTTRVATAWNTVIEAMQRLQALG